MCVTYAGTASASSIVTIATSRHQLQNTRAFLKSNSSDRSDKCHSRESIDLALSSFCFQKCQILAANASSGYSIVTKKENKILIIIGEKVEVFLIGSLASFCAVIELERS